MIYIAWMLNELHITNKDFLLIQQIPRSELLERPYTRRPWQAHSTYDSVSYTDTLRSPSLKKLLWFIWGKLISRNVCVKISSMSIGWSKIYILTRKIFWMVCWFLDCMWRRGIRCFERWFTDSEILDMDHGYWIINHTDWGSRITILGFIIFGLYMIMVYWMKDCSHALCILHCGFWIQWWILRIVNYRLWVPIFKFSILTI
mgnify:FL=1